MYVCAHDVLTTGHGVVVVVLHRWHEKTGMEADDGSTEVGPGD